MKRIHMKHHHAPVVTLPIQRCEEQKVNDAKVDTFVAELKDKLDSLHIKTDEAIDNVVPAVKFVVNEIAPIVECASELLDAEPERAIVTKHSIKINEPVIVPEKNEVVDDSEINTVTLDEPVLAHEECLLKVNPLANRPISHILSANVLFSNPCDGVFHEIVENVDEPNSFSLYLKNNRDEDLNVKICYSVKFT